MAVWDLVEQRLLECNETFATLFCVVWMREGEKEGRGERGERGEKRDEGEREGTRRSNWVLT